MHALLPSRRADARRRLAAPAAIAVAAALAVGGLAPVAAAEPIPTTTTLEVSATSLQTHHPLTLTATIAPIVAPDPAPPIVGTVLFKDVFGGDGTEFGPFPVVDGQAVLPLSTLAMGTHTFTAEFTGDGTYDDSKSAEVVVTVTEDLLEASGVGLSLSKFYPKVDGYKDTVKVRGTRVEPLTVAIAVKNSAGKTVRTASFAKAAGVYAWSWNGKNKAGKLQPAGKYTVWQTLRDGYTTKVVKSTLALSWKKLDWRTYTTSKTLRQAAKGGLGWAGWSFTVPAATVYGKLTVSAYAKGYGAVGAREAACGGTAWDLDCFYGRNFSGGWAWYSTSMPGKSFVSSAERVRVVVLNLGGKFGFEKVKITLKYAVLR